MGTAQGQINPNLFQDMQWRNIGPSIAGKVDSVSRSQRTPGDLRMGTDNGGVLEGHLNAGATWVPVTDAVQAARALPHWRWRSRSPPWSMREPGRCLVPTMAAVCGNPPTQEAHWQSAGLQDAGAIAWLLVHPQNPDLVLAATRGFDHRQGGSRGVFCQRGGGRTWTPVLNAQRESGATYLSWASDDPRVIFATVTQTYLAPGFRVVRSSSIRGPPACTSPPTRVSLGKLKRP